MTYQFHLSVVATSRNDGHGGDLIGRMQAFVDGFVAQCRRFDLAAELILVEWNPPLDRPGLAEVLTWPHDRGPWEIRIVTVPESIHALLDNSAKIPLFQMIAKNVGIRRARGEFVLATNIDILFSDEIVRFMRDKLRDGPIYRVDRCDVPPTVPRDPDFARVLDFCEREMFRINARGKTLIRKGERWVNARPTTKFLPQWDLTHIVAGSTLLLRRLGSKFVWRLSNLFAQKIRLPRKRRLSCRAIRTAFKIFVRQIKTGLIWFARLLRRTAKAIRHSALRCWHVMRAIYLRLRAALERLATRSLHTNACGDFTLCSRDVWFALRGYVEWPIFSWHLDSLLLHQARCNGYTEIDLPAPHRIFHIEHDIGSGYSPEGENSLFDRLERNAIPYLTWPDFLELSERMKTEAKEQGRVLYNGKDWGFAGAAFEEVVVLRFESSRLAAS